MAEKYSPKLVEDYVKKLRKMDEFKDIDTHFIEVAVLQYLFLDCNENKPEENDESYMKAKELFKTTDFSGIVFKSEIIEPEGPIERTTSDLPTPSERADSALENIINQINTKIDVEDF